ncbi:DUF1501 domain-containing protein [Planctomicrobium sp. SH661]|uniref:DUF1501 domain-containing protein n=1 Tax=Planctomicrobium sp. SH661 TaxID=3448124 RepID=UPI003F5C57F8
MFANYACRSPEHGISRRRFLGTMAAGAITGGLGVVSRPSLARQLQQDQKRVVIFNMLGGLSQFESWDPKPGANTGGPFLSIPTSVPGVHVSELLPLTAKQMHHLCIVRGMSTAEDEHSLAMYYMMTGRRQEPAATYPYMGAVTARMLSGEDASVPGNITIVGGDGGSRGNDSAYLGPAYSSLHLGDGKPPQYISLPDNVTTDSDQTRQQLREDFSQKFLSRRRSAMTQAYTYSYERAQRLMSQKDMFDVTKESAADRERYGKHDLGRHALLARRLLENGVTFVQVHHSNYDTHNDNFNFHLEQMAEFDRAFACFVEDIAQRGMLDSTLIAVVSEFGRTPGINHMVGRDHFSNAWSTVLGGARIPRGVAYGKTNAEGSEVVEGKVDAPNFFHTCLQAVGIDSSGSLEIDGRDVPLADPAGHPIRELLT